MSCHFASLRGVGRGQLLRYHTCIRYVTLHKLKEHHEKRRSDKGGGFVSFRFVSFDSFKIHSDPISIVRQRTEASRIELN